MTMPVGPLQAMVRNASGDGTVRVRVGTASCYCPRTHRVELDGDTLGERPREEVLAVAAHEGAHARLTAYHEQLRDSVLRDPLELRAVNVLEDARVDAWVLHAFPGLVEGQRSMHARCFGDELAPGELGPMPRCWRFVWGLRAAAVGRPRSEDPDPRVEQAIARCLKATRKAVDAWPRQGFDDAERLRGLSATFCRHMEGTVLPAFRRLLERDRAEAESQDATRRLEEVLARIADGQDDGAWKDWVEGRPQAWPGTPPSWSGRLEDIGGLLGGFANRLEQLLRPNALRRYVGGHRSGPRIDLRRAMAWEAGGSADGLFLRRVDPKQPVYRVAVLADLSSSMAGPRLEAMANAVALTVEACERLALEVGVVAFGTRDDVEVLKELDEPLAHRREALAAALIERPRLGSETPLAQGLDRVRAVLGPAPVEGHDLVLVVTDGQPRSSEWRYYDQPTGFSSSNDNGEETGTSVKSGRVRVWREPWTELQDVTRAVDALVGPSRTVLGVGIGEDAPVEELFEHARAYPDHEAFASEFPGLLEGALSELIA